LSHFGLRKVETARSACVNAFEFGSHNFARRRISAS